MSERVRGGYSIHKAENKLLCGHSSDCGPWRCVSCCEVAPDTDIEECARCGKQVETRCHFDEEYS